MKTFKILFLGFCTFLMSCGGGEIFRGNTIFDDWLFGTNDYSTHSDTTPVKTNYTFFNPPEWIQGEWNNIVEPNDMEWVKFTTNDFMSSQYSSWNSKMNLYNMWIEHEISNDSIYEVVIKSWGWHSEYIFKLNEYYRLDEYHRLHMEFLQGYITDWDNAELKEGTFRKKIN